MSDDAFDQLSKSKRSIGGGGDYAPWWNSENFDVEEGDELVGVVVEKHSYTDPGGEDHPIATVRSTGGQSNLEPDIEASTPTRTGIEDFVDETEVGDLVLIEYEGEVDTNTGRSMHAYAASKLTQTEWQEMDNADEILEVWQGSNHFRDSLVDGDVGN